MKIYNRINKLDTLCNLIEYFQRMQLLQIWKKLYFNWKNGKN